MVSVYQKEEYKKSLESEGRKIIEISDSFYCVERTIASLFGKRKILEARGMPKKEDLKKFKEISKSYFYGRIMPPSVNDKKDLFASLGYKRISNHTAIIDLSLEEDKLYKNLEKKSARWGVNRAKKNDLEFEELKDKKGIEKFYKMYVSTAKEGGFSAVPFEFLRRLADSGIARLFGVRHDSKIVAGGMILIDEDNNYSILDLTSSTDEGLKLQAMPFIYWNMMLYSKLLGLSYFDLGGYDKECKKGDKTYNINRFKERFGGRVIEQPIYSTNWKYNFLRSLMRKFRFLKGMYKK